MFTFPLSPADLFHERRGQFRAWGIPRAVIDRVEARVGDNWAEGPGGWVHEWWREAEAAERRQRWLEAAALYGAARFPVMSTPRRLAALEKQTACFLRAAPRFPARFERIYVRAGGEETVPIPVHVYQPRRPGRYPLVCLSGGVDTGKMELHRLAMAVAVLGRFRVAAVDMPGTGESLPPLEPGADAVYRGILGQLAGGTRRAVMGVSFGGHFAAKLALRGDVDAAVDWGGPIGAADRDAAAVTRLPNGMAGIVANAARLPDMPDTARAETLLAAFSLKHQGLLEAKTCAPVLAVNGGADPYIPAGDTEFFQRFDNAEVWLFPGLGHCAAEAATRIVPAMIMWLHNTLHGRSARGAGLTAAAGWLLPARRIAAASGTGS